MRLLLLLLPLLLGSLGYNASFVSAASARTLVLPVPVYQMTVASHFTDTHGAWGPLHPWRDDFVACWEFPRGAKLEVRYENKCCTVTVQDRGPAKHLVHRGRTLDLSEAAFKKLAPLSRGVIRVSWRMIPEAAGENQTQPRARAGAAAEAVVASAKG